ncbi:MAG: cell division protein FtsZ [Bacteroidales bacterium]|nr:cell division protein FtsZ [Bacteroidales bacterium]
MDILNFDLPKEQSSIIKVVGVGGGGNNAVNHMYLQGIKDVDFINCNTDHQALEASPVPIKIKLGSRELGAGSKPEVGRTAAEESKDALRELLENNTKMLFVTAGMGGGTGTGGAPVIASIAKDLNILTVGIVTAPFVWEGKRRNEQARAGIEELKKYVDIILVIENDKLREQYGDQKITDSFKKADDVLSSAARSIAEIITKHGLVNLDFEDINTVMNKGGDAIMGVGSASGEGRAIVAAEAAINSPLLNNNDINGAHKVLVHIASGNDDITMDEVSEITEFIQQRAGYNADVIWGFGQDENITEEISVTVIATGFEKKANQETTVSPLQYKLAEKQTVTTHVLEETPSKEMVINIPEMPSVSDNTISLKTPSVEESNMNMNIQIQKPETEIISEPMLISRAKSNSETSESAATTTQIEPPKRLNINSNWKDKPDADAVKELNALKAEQLKNYGILNRNRLTISQLQDLENTPAYLRRNVQLNNTPHSSESQISKYSLFEGEISETNTFLHVNVD